ncbi:MAG: bifunctional nuclease family protein [Dehalococcoidia bacterium]|nr:bifunctional nuclease family protein [Dehalococcoidia bacterium]
MLEMTIDSIRVSMMNYQRVVILKEKTSNRYLPIWIGPAEADAIAVQLQEVTVPRPLTHDLLRNVITTLGAAARHILVNDLQNDTFFAKIMLEANGKTIEVDSRPSDALALAVRFKIPIFVEEAVLDKASVLMDKEGKPITPADRGEPTKEGTSQVKAEEIQKLSAFKDFIENLDLGDIGKGKAS